MTARLIIVGGAPATGKTTLARELGLSLQLPVISKDDIKESLAAPFATGDREWSRRLGAATYSALFTVAEQILSAGHGLVLESNFTRTQSEARLRELTRIAQAVVIVCRIPDALRRGRFAARAQRGRHRVHIDDAILAEWSADDGDFLIDLHVPRLAVDTTNGYEPSLDRIVEFARTGGAGAR